MEHPFAGIPQDKIIPALVEAGRKHAEGFATNAGKILVLLGDVRPDYLLAILAAYGLTNFVSEDGAIEPKKHTQQILPAHVELAQALCLRLRPGDCSQNPAVPELTQAIVDTLNEWSDQFHGKRYVQLEKASTDVDRARLAFQESIRLSTQVVRNWGYYDHVKRISLELFGPLDARFEAAYGFRATDAILTFDYFFQECQRRLNTHWDRLRPMMGAETLKSAIADYYNAFPTLLDTADELTALLRERHTDLRSAQIMMIAHADLRLPDVYTFSSVDVAQNIQRPRESIVRLLDMLSQRFGDLRDANLEHFFMNNPVWTKPVIRLDGDKYFCVMPQLFFSFLFEAFTAIVKNNVALRTAFDDRRSDYLEQRTVEIFRAAFPDAAITANFKWQTDDKSTEFESDLIVHIDSFLILVEAKSGRVDPEARRGAPDSLGENIERLLVAPSRQSERLANVILQAKRGEAGTEELRKAFPIDLAKVHRILRLSVTLEDIGFLQTRINSLKQAAYVPNELHMAPAVTLADLEVVFEILRGPAEQLHYWVRRNDWEGHADYIADEIDLLGFYLKTGFNVGDLEFKNAHLVLVGESKPIDDYYEARRNGANVAPPSCQLTPWWRDIIARLAGQKPLRWIEAAVTLLSARIDEQQEFERRMKGLVADVRKHREAAANRSSLLFIPATGRREAIVICALMDSQINERHRLLANVASQAFAEHANIEQCVVIGLSADTPYYPYRTLGSFIKPNDRGIAS